MTRALAASFRLRALVLAVVGVAVGGWIGPAESLAARVPESLGDGLRGLVLVAWWALVGGALSRCAAAVLTHRDPPGLAAAMSGSARRLGRSLLPAAGVLVAAMLLCAPLWLHGALMNIPALGTLSALLLPLPMLCAMGAAVLLVLLAINWPLMVACGAVEQTDPFDVTSRAYAYVTQRPVRLAAYLLTALLTAVPVLAAAAAVDVVTPWLAADLLPTPQPDPGAADRVARFWLAAFDGLASRTVWAAYGWSAATAIYLLLRRDVDGVQFDEIDGLD